MGVITDAGILKDEKLTIAAKTKFIKEVKDELVLGTANAPVSVFPCGPTIPPFQFANLLELEDESKFPEFHKNVLGQYEKIANALDSNGRFTILPICCPVSLAFSLGIDAPQLNFPGEFLIYSFALPLTAIKLGFDLPIDLVAKFPSLIELPVPSLKIPELDFDPLEFPDLFKFNASLNGIPPALLNIILEMLIQMPKLLLGILQLDFKPFCDVILKAEVFGPFNPNEALTWVVSQKVLARKVAEMLLINVVGTTIGSSSGGIVGGLGSFLGYAPPPPKGKVSSTKPRDAILKSLKIVTNTSWSKDKKSIKNDPPDKLRLMFTSYLLPQEVDDGKNGKSSAAHKKAGEESTKKLFARAALFRGGAMNDYFTKEYRSSSKDKLDDLAENANAKIKVSKTSFPAVKAGDVIMCDNCSIIVTKNRSSSLKADVEGVIGGLTDSKNDNKRTKIDKGVLKCSIVGNNLVLTLDDDEFIVKYAVNSENLVKNG